AQWGTAGSSALVDVVHAGGTLLLPSPRNTDLPWYNVNRLQVALSTAAPLAPSDVSLTGITVANYGPVTVSPNSGSNTTYTITFAQGVTVADALTLTIGNSSIT